MLLPPRWLRSKWHFIAIYWAGLIGGENLADRGVADPAVTMWMANAVFLVLGIYLAATMSRTSISLRGGAFDGLVDRLRARVSSSPQPAEGEAAG